MTVGRDLQSNRRFVVVASALPPPVHGQSAVTQQVVGALRDAPCDLRVVNTTPGRLERGLFYHAAKAARVVKGALVLILNGSRSDKAFYSTAESGWGVLYNLLLVVAARVAGYSVFLHHHTSSYLKRRTFGIGLLVKLAGPRAWHIVLSQAMAADLRDVYPKAGAIRIVNNACWAQGEPMPTRPLRAVGMLGNLTVEKGLGLALAACLEWRRRGVEVRLVLAGPVIGAEARQLLAEAAPFLRDALDCRGRVSGREKAAFFEDVEVVLFPTKYRHEAQPLVMLEALACARPVIYRRLGYTDELAGPSGAGIDAEAPFAECAADFVQIWARQPDDLGRKSAEARLRYEEMLSESLAQFSALIADLAGQAKAAPTLVSKAFR